MDITDEWGIESSCRFSFPQELQLELGAGSEAGTSGRLCLPEKCPLPGTLHPLALAKLQRSVSTTTSTSSTSSTSSTTTTSTSTTSTTLLPPEGDFDGNSQRDAVGFLLLEVLEGDPEFPPQFDLDGDGGLDADDLVEFVKLLFAN